MGNSQMKAKRTIGVFLPLFIIAVLLTLNYSGCEKHNPIIFEGQLSGAKILLRLPDLDKPSQQGDFDITLTVCVQGGGSTVHQMEVKDYNVQGNLEVPAEKYLWIEAEAEIDTQMYKGESDTLFLSPGKITTVMITLDPAIGPTPNHPPNPPSSPYPADGATEQPLNVVLSWSCSDPDSGDALTFDVYFGSDSMPPLVSSTQSEKTYDPPENLERNQTYYWKIVAMDSHYDQTAGPIWSFATVTDTSIITFADSNLEQAVRNWIGKPTGDILISDVDTITYFQADSANIQNIEGIEYFHSLHTLGMWSNQISDLTPLQNLTQLTTLSLYNNQVSDIAPLQNLAELTWLELTNNQISDPTPLQNLTQLMALDLGGNQLSDLRPLQNLAQLYSLSLWDNQISDLTPLQNLTQLYTLHLADNQISDTTPLQNLTQLRWLYLRTNQITDITALQNLTQLIWLDLGYNQIEDILPLVNNSGMDDGDTVRLEENPLSDTSINEYIPALQERGVTVYY
jgi:hypothetical protein